MNRCKWLSDEELNSCKVLGGIEYWPHIIDQAREANRLRESLTKTCEFYERTDNKFISVYRIREILEGE